MFEQHHFLKKEYGLILFAFLLLLASYQFALKKTIVAWQLHSTLKKQLVVTANSNYEPAYLERKNNNLSNIINLYKVDTIGFRSSVLSTISLIAQKRNVKLADVPVQNAANQASGHDLQKLSFEGNYFDLLKTLNDLQATRGIGIIREVKLYLPRTSVEKDNQKLLMEIHLEITKERT